MTRLILLLAVASTGCGGSTSTSQPEPVQLDRRFFEEKGDPGQQRPMPKPVAQ